MASKYEIVLLLIVSFRLFVSGRRVSQCSTLKEKFSSSKPAVAATIPDAPEYDGSLELCRFTNHSENQRPSCCTHDTERELLLTAQQEYSDIIHGQTVEVVGQMAPGRNLHHHFERMLAISKRMTEYEIGNKLRLPHVKGRQIIQEFYTVLENVLIRYDRNTSVFSAMDTMVDNLFVYVVREGLVPGSNQEPETDVVERLKSCRRSLEPSPFPVSLKNQATSLHYASIAASYLSEAMGVIFQALELADGFKVSDHCLRDLMKINHCQKCYGYTEMRPCRIFCEDVFMVCLNRVIRLDKNWEYHRKIVKILSEYILTRVELQSILNTFHTDLMSSFEMAIAAYSQQSYKKNLQDSCGPTRFTTTSLSGRHKHWEKPETTSYEGDFTGDLRQLVVNLELKIQGFFANLHSSICANEPTDRSVCWYGLTERVNKKKKILKFADEFAGPPDKDDQMSSLVSQIKRIRNDVLKIFLRSNKKQKSDDSVDGSGSGDYENESPPDDTEPGDDSEEPLSRSPNLLHNKPADQTTVANHLSTIYTDKRSRDNSIEIVDDNEKTTPQAAKPNSPRASTNDAISKGEVSAAASHRLSTFSVWANAALVIVYLLY